MKRLKIRCTKFEQFLSNSICYTPHPSSRVAWAIRMYQYRRNVRFPQLNTGMFRISFAWRKESIEWIHRIVIIIIIFATITSDVRTYFTLCLLPGDRAQSAWFSFRLKINEVVRLPPPIWFNLLIFLPTTHQSSELKDLKFLWESETPTSFRGTRKMRKRKNSEEEDSEMEIDDEQKMEHNEEDVDSEDEEAERRVLQENPFLDSFFTFLIAPWMLFFKFFQQKKKVS